jgi:copper homeostasis protein
MDFEVCIDSVEGAIAASKYGAKRVELCAALSEGGLTPSIAMVNDCVKNCKADVFVMVRPSAGGFNYTDNEIMLMERDIQAIHSTGAKGVVFGILNEKFGVDIPRNLYLMETVLKLDLRATFHRAIDLCSDMIGASNDIINLGFERILSSGGYAKAEDGINRLHEMKNAVNGKIEIMAGSGVNPGNVHLFSELPSIHFTAHSIVNEGLNLDMGTKTKVDERKIKLIANAIINVK